MTFDELMKSKGATEEEFLMCMIQLCIKRLREIR